VSPQCSRSLAGTKLLPLLFFPAYLKEVKGKGRYAALFFSVFLGGLAAQLLLNANNTLRTLSFESHYGVEGSWLGFLFPGSVIQYRVATWIIGDATTLTVKPVYFVSAALLLPSTILVYVSRLTLEHKMFLILSLEVAFLWISPPQFMLNLAALAPLVFEVDWKKVASWWAVTIFATPLPPLRHPLTSSVCPTKVRAGSSCTPPPGGSPLGRPPSSACSPLPRFFCLPRKR